MTIRNNHDLMHQVIENMEYMVRVIDQERRVIYMNQKMREHFGHTMGNMCYDLLGGSEKCENCITTHAKESGKPEQKDVCIGDKFYKLMTSPVSIEDEKNYSIELLHDITKEKKTELELLAHYEKLKEDISFAKQIQYRALPIDGVYWDLMKIDSLYIQSEDLGGDFYDIIKLDENRMLLYIADISGHGVKSSLLTIFLRQVLRGISKKEDLDLTDVLEELIKSYKDLHTNPENYLTILWGIYDQRTQVMSFINAGHNCLPILLTNENKVSEIPVRGMPICSLLIEGESSHEKVEVKLEKGDRIILYTDGISESYSKVVKRQFGSEGIIELLEEVGKSKSKTLCGKIIQSAAAFAGITPIDDMAILIAEAL